MHGRARGSLGCSQRPIWLSTHRLLHFINPFQRSLNAHPSCPSTLQHPTMFNAPWATSSPSPTSPQFLSPPGQFGPSRYGRLQTSSERYHLNESPTAYVGQLPTQDYTDDSAGVRGILVT